MKRLIVAFLVGLGIGFVLFDWLKKLDAMLDDIGDAGP